MKFPKLLIFSLLVIFNQCYHSKQQDVSILSLLSLKPSPIRVTFVGDSLAQYSEAFGLKQKLPSNYILTDLSVAGYDTKMWLSEIAKIQFIPTDIWVIELGTNDASYSGTAQFKERYSSLLNQLQSQPFSFLLLSTVPLSNQLGLQKIIQTNNEAIRELIPTSPKYRLGDLESVFSLYSGSVPLYSLADPIHPNQIGYELIGEEYRKILIGL